jgi:hypothetical protein
MQDDFKPFDAPKLSEFVVNTPTMVPVKPEVAPKPVLPAPGVPMPMNEATPAMIKEGAKALEVMSKNGAYEETPEYWAKFIWGAMNAAKNAK